MSLFLSGFLFLQAQTPPKGLGVGDKIPDALWTKTLQIVNQPQKTMTLEEDKDKLILLDFWGTWCSSCLLNFPKMEALEQKYKDHLKVIAVTYQQREEVEKFFRTDHGRKYNKVLSIIEDEYFRELFPHYGVPYIVWLKNGKVLNMTDAAQVSEETVSEIIKGDKSSLQTVIRVGRERPLMLSENFDLERDAQLLAYNFFAKGRIRAAIYGSYFRRENGVVYGRQITNATLMDIYKTVVREILTAKGQVFTVKQVVNQVKTPLDIDFPPEESRENDLKWYSIETIVPVSEAESLYENMLSLVNNNSDYWATIEYRPARCLVLKRTSRKDKIAAKGQETREDFFKPPFQYRNVGLGALISILNSNNKITDLPVLNETGYEGKVDMDFSEQHDLKTLRSDLARYDLALKEVTRTLPFLVITDKR